MDRRLIARKIILPEAQSPPLPPEQRNELLSQSALGRRLLEVSALSPLEFVERHFENDVVRAGLLFFNGLREVDLRAPGFGYTIPSLIATVLLIRRSGPAFPSESRPVGPG